jgi:predicted acetyltransferase
MSSATETVELIRPSPERLAAYAAALRRGWSADNVRGQAAADEELRQIGEDAQAFAASLEDRDPRGRSVVLPDGTMVPRLPGFRRWVWDGDFCGSIGFRWQPGTSALPSYVLGHIGYAIVPWKRGRGYASRALGLLLPEAWREGLAHVDLTTDPDNLASQKVILNNGGRLVGRLPKAAAYGGGESLLFRIFASAADRR